MSRTPRSRIRPSSVVPAMIVAFVFATALAILLGIIVLRPIFDGRGDESAGLVAVAAVNAPPLDTGAPAATVTPSPTESSAWTPWPDLAAVRNEADDPADVEPAATRTPEPRPARTPEPQATGISTSRVVIRTGPAPTATVEATALAYYLAEAASDFRAWSGASWKIDGPVLANDGTDIQAKPWIAGPVLPPDSGGYAIEAEIRIDGLASGFCKQSLGLVAPLEGGAYVGAGLLYECDGSGTRARITDVSDYANGYFQDREFAAKPLDLATGWHTLRLEVDGDRIRLLIDGDLVLSTTAGSRQARNPDGALGLWSEGVEVSVRRIAVVALETV